MGALILVLLITVAACHWLFEPLLHLALAPFQLAGLPWLGLAAGAWLLAGTGKERP